MTNYGLTAMANGLSKIGSKFIHSNSMIFTLIRSGLSAQMCGWLDLGVSFAMFAWLDLKPVYAAAIGAFVGGVANCIVNYKFTYHVKDCPWNAVIVKFIMVWIGSLMLNAFGTEAIYWVLTRWKWLETIGFKPDGFFTAARLATALIVSLAWNFLLQVNFVYKHVKFDRHAIKIANIFLPRKYRKTE